MMRLVKKRLEDTFRIGKENGFRRFFRNWLSADGFGICRPCRTAKNAPNSALGHNQAAEAVQSVPRSESGSTASESPGNVDLWLVLKRREQRAALSGKTKAVQE
jgi:hypothetical protein